MPSFTSYTVLAVVALSSIVKASPVDVRSETIVPISVCTTVATGNLQSSKLSWLEPDDEPPLMKAFYIQPVATTSTSLKAPSALLLERTPSRSSSRAANPTLAATMVWTVAPLEVSYNSMCLVSYSHSLTMSRQIRSHLRPLRKAVLVCHRQWTGPSVHLRVGRLRDQRR